MWWLGGCADFVARIEGIRGVFIIPLQQEISSVFIPSLLFQRYDSNSGGEREIQRTMLELLNQLDGFDSRGDVKVIMATNRIETLDPALIRPGQICFCPITENECVYMCSCLSALSGDLKVIHIKANTLLKCRMTSQKLRSTEVMAKSMM